MISQKPAVLSVLAECEGEELAGMTLADETLAP
jgi:hypothetical protein